MARLVVSAVPFAAALVFGCAGGGGEAPHDLVGDPIGNAGPGPGDSINPQPQPNPGQMPGVDLTRVSLGAIKEAEIELIGAPGAAVGGATAIDFASLAHPGAVGLALPAADGSFRVTVGTHAGERLIVLASAATSVGFPVPIEIKASGVDGVEECLDAGATGRATGGARILVTLSNGCDTAVRLTPRFSSPNASADPVTLAPHSGGSLVVNLSAALTRALVVALDDDAGRPRVGTLLNP